MSYCPTCGKENKVAGNFCTFCGAKLLPSSTGGLPAVAPKKTAVSIPVTPQYEVEVVSSAPKPPVIKTLGAVVIDEANRQFYVPAKYQKKKESSALGKLARGTLAFSTAGMSLLAEKAFNAVSDSAATPEWFDFSSLTGYRVLIDNQKETVRQGSSVRKKGFSLRSGKSVSKNVTHSLSILLSLDSLDCPFIEISIMDKPLSGKAFENAQELARYTQVGLDYIKSH